MHHDLYKSIQGACCHIGVTLRDELISEGSGFAFTESGQVLTAAHVITGRMPIRDEDYKDPAQRVFCKFPDRPQTEYTVALCGMTIQVIGFTDALQVDVALLNPKLPLNRPVPHLRASLEPPKLGDLVFAAGYSDEIRTPFELDRLIPGGVTTLNQVAQSSHTGYMADLGGPLIKRGIVGRIVRSTSTYSGRQIHIDLFHVDNAMHSGASGGPICNINGDAIGIITERAVTSASQEQAPGIVVPSGCTIGISLQSIKALGQA